MFRKPKVKTEKKSISVVASRQLGDVQKFHAMTPQMAMIEENL